MTLDQIDTEDLQILVIDGSWNWGVESSVTSDAENFIVGAIVPYAKGVMDGNAAAAFWASR